MKDEDIDDVQDSYPLDTNRTCYGNKPNLRVQIEPESNISIQEEEERKNIKKLSQFQ